jgi:putative chitinase
VRDRHTQEYAYFLAHACNETDRFKALREHACGEAFEGRAALDNTQLGGGVKFKGRRNLFINTPELLEQPEYVVCSASEFWRIRNLNDPVNHENSDILKKHYRGNVLDALPIEFIIITINGGCNGMDKRKKYLFAIANGLLT